MTDDPRLQAFGSQAGSLRDELGGDFTDERLQDWIGDIAERREFLADMILGTITWSKGLGRPTTPCRFEAFEVFHDFHVPPSRPGDEPDTWDWNLPDRPVLFDAEGDQEHYSVGFFARLRGARSERISVRLRNEIPWQEQAGNLPGFRHVDPPFLTLSGFPSGKPVPAHFEVVRDIDQKPGRLLGGYPLPPGGGHSSGGSGAGGA